MVMSTVLLCVAILTGTGTVDHRTDSLTKAMVVGVQEVFFVHGILVDQSVTSIDEPIQVFVSRLPTRQALQKAKLYRKIALEMARLRAIYPEPTADDPQVSMDWFERLADAKAVRLNGLLERYFAIQGQVQTFWYLRGSIHVGDILSQIPRAQVLTFGPARH